MLPLFVASIVAGSFFFGYLRIWTGSVWPASIAHSSHNVAWGTLPAFTVISNPMVVNEYLVGDNGILPVRSRKLLPDAVHCGGNLGCSLADKVVS
jgi:hypothetical protein